MCRSVTCNVLHCLWDSWGRCVLIHGLKWPADSSVEGNVVSNTVVGQYIKMRCLFLTSPPDFPLYSVEHSVKPNTYCQYSY